MEHRKKPHILLRILDGIEVALGPIIMLTIVVVVFLQVLSRTLPGSAIPWTVELGEILLGALVWFGIGVGVSKNSHVGFDLLVRSFTPKWKKIFGLLNLNLFIFYLILLGYFTLQLLGFYQKLSARTTILQIGMFWVRLPILIGCFLTLIRLVIKQVRVIQGKEHMYVLSSDNAE
jgi:TRAP-type C4-dicarboxylate transport system permease small subunit